MKGRGCWIATPAMQARGFQHVRCGPDGPAAWEIAAEWEARWQRTRRGQEVSSRPMYPRNSVGGAYERYRRTDAWESKAPRTREDWDRGWAYIAPYFADVAPRSITFEMLDRWYAGLRRKRGIGEAFRAMKIWRALYTVMAGMKLCPARQDPSHAIRRRTPAGRTETWAEGEVARLIKGAWRAGYRGMACVMAVAWDTGFAPVDVRTLTPGRRAETSEGWGFKLARAKTGEPALGTLSKRTRRLVEAYVAGLGYDLHDDAPMFRTKGHVPTAKGGKPRPGAPYTKDSLADDFRAVRRLVFGVDENRKLMDMRRSGFVESRAGGASAEAMSAKYANSIDQNRALQRTYLPVDPATVAVVDAARVLGRQLLRRGKPNPSKV
jgi:hypothetical protein